jgi:multidrug resistance efflux pump
MPLRRFGRPGLLGTVARTAVIAGTATMTANAVSRHQQTRQAEQAALQQEQLQAGAPPPPPPEETDLVSQLARLAQLRDAGVLTKEEFQQAKAELLSG